MTLPRTGPELSVVDNASEQEGAGNAPRGGSPPSSQGLWSRRVPFWLLVAVVVIAVLLSIIQAWRARDLAVQVASLEAEVAVAGEKLRAYQSHLDGVRSGVDELARQLEALQVLVGRDPLAPVVEAETGEAAVGSEADSPAPGGVSDGPPAALDAVPGPAPIPGEFELR